MKKLLNVLLIIVLAFLWSCSDSDKNGTEPNGPTEFEMVAEVADDYLENVLGTNNMTATDLAANLLGANAADYQVLDWRGATDYEYKHIMGAINIALPDLVDKVEDGTIDPNKTIINVCYTGQTASYATMVLNLIGFDAYNVKFGMCGITSDTEIVSGSDKWVLNAGKFAGYIEQLETSVNTVSEEVGLPELDTGEENAIDILKNQFYTVTHSWTVSMDVVWDNTDDYYIINYWPQSQYENPGHIPGAYCFEPTAALTSEGNLNYLPLPTDKMIAVYCYTGQTSAQLTAYLRLLGYDAYSILFGMNGIGPEGYLKYSEPTDPTFLDILED